MKFTFNHGLALAVLLLGVGLGFATNSFGLWTHDALQNYRRGLHPVHVQVTAGLFGVAAVLLCFRRTRSAALLLAGGGLGVLGGASVLISGNDKRALQFWDGAGNQWDDRWHFSGLWPLVAVTLAWVGLVLLALFRDRAEQAEHAAHAEETARQLEVISGEKQRATVRRDHTAAQLQQEKDSKEKLQRRLNDVERARPYESQLVAALTLALGVAWQRWRPQSPFGLNHHQGNLDQDFADFLGQAEGRCWLVELKRTRAEIPAEYRKAVRTRQCNALQSEAGRPFAALAKQCHWLGWGEGTAEVTLRFNAYWANWPRPATAGEFTLDQFVERVFGKAGTTPVGVAPGEFAAYLRFLAAEGNPAADPAEGTVAALVFRLTANGRLECWVQPDLGALCHQIEARYEMQAKQREIERRERERNVQPDGPGKPGGMEPGM
jgi:hypothetical protein